MALKEGWRGRFFEDFEVGDVYRHPLGRTVTTTDNIWFTLLTQNTAPIHFDHHYASQTEFRKPLVDSTFTVALVTGQSVTDISQNVMANLGWDEVRLPAPVFEGDTIYSQSEVLEKRPSGSRPNVGIGRPVRASIAKTMLQLPVVYITPSTTIGVASSPRVVSVSKDHARPSPETLPSFICFGRNRSLIAT